VAMAFFSLVPVVGSGLIFVPASLWLGFTGHWGRAILLLAICAGVSTIVDNVLRPLLIKKGADLSLLLIIPGVIGGLLWLGIIGLFVGPVILAVTSTLLESWISSGLGDEMPAPAAAVTATPRPMVLDGGGAVTTST